MMAAPAALLVANYGNRVGYAWHNIYRLYSAIGRALAARGVRVVISFPAIDGALDCIDADVPFEPLVFDARGWSADAVAQLRPELQRLGIRYVYLTDQPATHASYLRLRLAGVRRIVVHNRISVDDPLPPPPETGLKRLMRSAVARVPLANADRIYAVSGFVTQRLVEKARIPPGRVRTILNGIDVESWACPPPDARPEVVFFAAARAARYKGIGVLIEAAAKLRARAGFERFRIRYAGDGPDLGSFKDMVRRFGLEDHVAFIGRVENTRAEICAADVIVVPSMNGDACPSTVSESLASGRPLITTRAGGIPELVGGEDNAVLVPPGDVDAMAAAMAGLISSPERRREVGARGRARAEGALRRQPYHETVVAALMEDFGLGARGPASS